MSDSLHVELSQIIQNFDKVNLREVEPITKNINKNIFEEDLSIVIDELVNLYIKDLNEGKPEELRKQHVLDNINNKMINLQEIYFWLLNNQNDSNSNYLLGYFNYHGIEININKQKALKFYHNAANLGNNVALYYLSIMYMDGGVDKNSEKAFEFSKKLADKKYSSGIYLLGRCYENGIGTVVNEQKAFELYQKAADLGNIHGMNLLGNCYENGTGTVVNKQKAFELYQKVANLEDSDGIINLGFCYKDGTGTVVNEQKAFELYQKAADLENLYGMSLLGGCYENGVGTVVNKQKAFELYQKSANLGNNVAQYYLALMYENGEGTEKDINKAIYWYNEAAEQGDEDAQNKLNDLLNE